MYRFVLLLLAGAGLLSAQPAGSPSSAPAQEVPQIPPPGRFRVLFQSFRTDNAAISPDGKYLAYSVREGEAVLIYVIEIDHPEKITTRAQVIDDEGATPMMAMRQKERTPGRIIWLGWTSPTRLVLETNRITATVDASGNWRGVRGSVIAFNADGGKPKVLANPDDLAEFTSTRDPLRPSFGPTSGAGPSYRADQPAAENGPTVPVADDRLAAQLATGGNQVFSMRVLGYDPDRPGALILRAASPRVVATYSLNTETGKLKPLAEEPIEPSEEALIDRQGRPRLTISRTRRGGFPLRYEYRGPKGTQNAGPLDQASGLTGFSVSPENYFGERAVPLGFDYQPDVLYYAANTGRNTFGLYSVNLATKQRGRLMMENPNFDLIDAPESGFSESRMLVFDRFQQQLAGVRFSATFGTTAWVNPAWQEIQAGLEKTLPGLGVKIIDWDQSGKRLVVTTEGPADPGAVYLYDAVKGKLLEFARRAPWIDATTANRTQPFAFANPDGTTISGLLTVPRQPRLRPIPLVVFCPDLPWQRVRSDFQAEVQALADMGFVVAQLNNRGVWGFGLAQRQPLVGGYDQMQVDDIATAVAQLARTFPVNADRVALIGRGHGGFIALRALQAHPAQFRCAIALDAPVDLGSWLAEQRWTGGGVQPALTTPWFGDPARLQANPLAGNPAAVVKPILMLNYPGASVDQRRTTYTVAHQFAESVRAHGTKVEFGDLDTDYMNGLPGARAAVFDRIEAFLNLHVYDFTVKLPEMEIKK